MKTPYFTRFGGPCVVLVCLSLLLAACEPAEEPEALEGDQDIVSIEVHEMEGDPMQYLGRTVEVEGEIEVVYGSNAFTLEGDDFSGAVLVVLPPSVNTTDLVLEEDAQVQVQGIVHPYVRATIESDHGLVDFDDVIEYEEHQPMVVAQSITVDD